MADYDNPLAQMKAISYNLKRIADSLEDIAQALPKDSDKEAKIAASTEAFKNFFKDNGKRNYFSDQD